MNKFILFALLILSFAYSTNISILITSGVSSNLENFPAKADVPTEFISGLINSTHCANIRFYDSDGITELPFDVDDCNLSYAKITYWVRIPTLTPTKKIIASIQPMNTSYENVSGVWGPAGYTFVWHANNDTIDYSYTGSDSIVGAGSRTYTTNPVCIGKCMYRTSNTNNIHTNNFYTVSTTGITFSGITNITGYNTEPYIVSTNDGVCSEVLHILVDVAGKRYVLYSNVINYICINAFTYSANNTFQISGLGRIVASINVSQNQHLLIVNNQSWNNATNIWNTISSRIFIGSSSSSSYSSVGYFDEYRISNTSRSMDWILAEQRQFSYANIFDASFEFTPNSLPFSTILNKKYYIAKLNHSYYIPKVPIRNFLNSSNNLLISNNTFSSLYGVGKVSGKVVCGSSNYIGEFYIGGKGTSIEIWNATHNQTCFMPIRIEGNITSFYELATDVLQTPAYSTANVSPLNSGIYRNTKYYNKTIVYYDWGSNLDLNSYYSNTSNFPCRALLVYGDKILTPDVYYDIDSGYFIPDIVEPTTNYVRLRNNTALYFYDLDYNSWFYAPPFICDPNYVYTISAYVYEQSAYSAPIHLPKIYLKKNCYINGSSYVIDIYTSSPSDFGVYVNGTLDYSGASYALSKSYNANSNITVKDGNNILCHHEVGKYAYFFTDMFSPNIVKLIGGVFTVLLVAIGLVYPTASLGIIVLNDMFQMMRVADAVFISLIVVAASVLTRITRRSLKNIGFYLGLMFVGVVYLVANYGNTYSSPYTVDISELQAANQEWEQFSSSLAKGGDVIAIILGGLTLLFSLLVLLLKLPLIIWHIILAPVFYINPYLYAGMVSLGQIITIGVGVYVIVMLYITWQRVFIEP